MVMKRKFFLATLALFTLYMGYSQEIPDVQIVDYTLELTDDKQFNIDVDIDLSQLKVKTTQVVVLTPYIKSGDNALKLKSVAVYGRNRRIYYRRNEDIKPTVAGDITLTTSEARDIVSYSTTVPFVDWMDGCSVDICRNDFGCCGHSIAVARVELVDRFPIEQYHPELIYLRPEHEVIKSRHISGSAFVDFPVSQIVIYPDYRNNTVELAKITGTIDSVKSDKDVTIKSISIKGYASPESPYSNNTYLAKGRTEALKEYVESLYHFGEGFIKTDYEPEDWAGLERYVEASSLPHRDEILAAIRSDREPDAKEWVIKSKWSEDYRFLLKNCYPALRHSDYVIEYVIRSYSNPVDIERILHSAPQNLSLEEFYILAQTYEPGSDKFNELFETAVRMYPNDPVANLNAANSAILKGDYSSALRYLDKAGDMAEAIYARGVLEIYRENNEAARALLEEAKQRGVSQAEEALVEISKNRNLVTMNNNK
jgi:tetratricopeptide (TPR) repeat protein